TLPPIEGDRKRLLQILLNLLSNAAKFTERGEIAVETYKEDNSILIKVMDTGPGITAEDHEKVFQAFAQTETGLRQGSGGTGLGMPICKKLVELHGGQLWFERCVGQGSQFFVRLPQ